MTKVQSAILRIVGKGEQLDDEEIAKLLKITPFKAAQVLREMERAGLVTRVSQDGRK